MTRFCVVVDYIDGAEWAMVLTAERVGDTRKFIPTIFAFDTDGLFATCPRAYMWAREGKLILLPSHGKIPTDREKLLRNAATDFVDDIHRVGCVLEYTRAGWANSAVAAVFGPALLPNFSLGDEPAFRWLFEHHIGAVQAMLVCRALVQKRGLDKLGSRELEAIGTRQILKGY